MNEADTCRTLVRPKLESSGWDGDQHFYSERTSFTDGRIVVTADKPRRLKKKLMPEYLMYWLSQPVVQAVINNEQKGATRQGFTKRQVESLSLNMPPVEIQKRIVSSISKRLEYFSLAAQDAGSAGMELNAILPAALGQIFRGDDHGG